MFSCGAQRVGFPVPRCAEGPRRPAQHQLPAPWPAPTTLALFLGPLLALAVHPCPLPSTPSPLPRDVLIKNGLRGAGRPSGLARRARAASTAQRERELLSGAPGLHEASLSTALGCSVCLVPLLLTHTHTHAPCSFCPCPCHPPSPQCCTG